MHIEYSQGLLLASLSVAYGGRSKAIPRMSIDTGAAHTIVVSDVVDDIGIVFKTGDHINRSQGIGVVTGVMRRYDADNASGGECAGCWKLC